jgi:DoxX-like protein
MTTNTIPVASHSIPTSRRWTARIITGIPVVFLAFDGIVKLANPSFVTEASAKLGIPANFSVGLGIVLLACLGLYLVRRTAPLGAVLLTGYFGGAVFVHLRVGDPVLTHVLAPVYVATLLWLGLYLRDERVRRLLAR